MKRFLPLLIIVVVLGAGVAVVKSRSADSAGQTQYKVSVAVRGPVKKTVSATGTLQPWSTVDIKSKAGGRINALLVDVGSVVKSGQVLARIDPADTLLTVSTAEADIGGAVAHTRQSEETYRLQLQQGQIAIANAQAALSAAEAAQQSAAAQAAAQPAQTAAAIAQARANLNAAVQDRASLDATNPQDQAAAQAAYDQAVANQTNAKAAYARQTSLVQKGYVAQQDVDTAQAAYQVDVASVQSAGQKLRTLNAQQTAAVQSADAKVAQARAALQSAQAGQVDVATRRAAALQAAAQVAQAQSTLAQARADLANNGIKQLDVAYNQSVVQSNQASLTNAQTTLAQTVVRAPSDGIVLAKAVSQGTYITSGESLNSTGSTIVTLGDVSRMYVQATVDETDLASVDENQSVEVDFDAYPGIPFDGKVTRIEPQAVVNQNVTQYNVRVEIDNSSPTFRLLKPGMNATCNFLVSSKDDALTVPSAAVQTDDTGSFVQVARGGTPAPADPASGTTADPDTLVGVKLQRRVVETGIVGDDVTEITSGLQAGEKVVTQTIAPVTTAPAAASSPFGGGGGRPGGR